MVMFESVFSSTNLSGINLVELLMALGAALLLGLATGIIYIKINKNRLMPQNYALTLAILPVIVTVIIMLVGNNVARAFSLAGAFSIIRFRSAPGDPKDIAFILFSMAIGLSCGMGFLIFALITTVLMCFATVILELFKFGKVDANEKILKITIPESLNYQNAFDEILDKYTLSRNLIRIKTADLGSIYELMYLVKMNNNINEKEFIDELRCRNGNLTVSLVLDVQQMNFK